MSTIKADNIATLAGVSTSMANAVNGSAKAWVNFNGTGTVAIRRAFNVSSITDLGIGNYRLNFTTAMADANYSLAGSSYGGVTGSAGPDTRTPMTTNAVTVYTGNPGSFNDSDTSCFVIFS